MAMGRTGQAADQSRGEASGRVVERRERQSGRGRWFRRRQVLHRRRAAQYRKVHWSGTIGIPGHDCQGTCADVRCERPRHLCAQRVRRSHAPCGGRVLFLQSVRTLLVSIEPR